MLLYAHNDEFGFVCLEFFNIYFCCCFGVHSRCVNIRHRCYIASVGKQLIWRVREIPTAGCPGFFQWGGNAEAMKISSFLSLKISQVWEVTKLWFWGECRYRWTGRKECSVCVKLETKKSENGSRVQENLWSGLSVRANRVERRQSR